MTIRRACVVCCAIVLAPAMSVQAGIVSFDPTFHLLDSPPASVGLGMLQSDTFAYVFAERQGVLLSQDLEVNITEPGFYDTLGSLTPGLLPGGTKVSSFLIHLDNDESEPGAAHVIGTIVFDEPILAVITSNPQLHLSDSETGSEATLYPPGGTYRGLEFGDDTVLLSEDRMSLTIDLRSTGARDQIRIITGQVPGPGGLAVLGVASLLGARRRRW